jgi:hypothetical protein
MRNSTLETKIQCILDEWQAAAKYFANYPAFFADARNRGPRCEEAAGQIMLGEMRKRLKRLIKKVESATPPRNYY